MEGGPDLKENGLIPRGINLIFEKMKKKEKFGWKVNIMEGKCKCNEGKCHVKRFRGNTNLSQQS